MGTDVTQINNKSGFKRYGVIKNPYILVKGSVQGPSKRLIVMSHPARPKKLQTEEQTIEHIHK